LNINLLAVKTLEFFAGIGGLHAACPWLDILCAFDIDRDAQRVYQANFTSPYKTCELASIKSDLLDRYPADLWWLSPPCTPFTRKGAQKDLDDPRTLALVHLINQAARIRPKYLVLENVVGFESSRTAARIQEELANADFEMTWICKCPHELQWPNRRPRVYLIAWQNSALTPCIQWLDHPSTNQLNSPHVPSRLAELIDRTINRDNHPWLWLDESTCERFKHALDRVMIPELVGYGDPGDSSIAKATTTACFASGYATSIVRSGSVIWHEKGWRKFSPREVANLLGFPPSFSLPGELGPKRLWQLLGNSLSLPVVAGLMAFTRFPNARKV
jgi:site-specific DNA-cytosine methylase